MVVQVRHPRTFEENQLSQLSQQRKPLKMLADVWISEPGKTSLRLNVLLSGKTLNFLKSLGMGEG